MFTCWLNYVCSVTFDICIVQRFEPQGRHLTTFPLLGSSVIILFSLTHFLCSHLFSFPVVPSFEVCIIHHSFFPGIDEASAAWLLSAIGIANTIGRVVFGFMADLRWVNRLMLYNTALTICGVATALSPFVGGNYALLMTYAAIFGIFIGRCGCLCWARW